MSAGSYFALKKRMNLYEKNTSSKTTEIEKRVPSATELLASAPSKLGVRTTRQITVTAEFINAAALMLAIMRGDKQSSVPALLGKTIADTAKNNAAR